jgi:serine/threonine-protein kinase
LGALALLSDGDAQSGVRVPRRQLAQLAVLAAAGPAGVTRDRLFALFWPDKDAEHASHALDQSLYATRRVVSTEAIVANSASVRLDTKVLPSDVAAFSLALERGDLDGAVAAYGGPFLDAVYLPDAPEFERWVESSRRQFSHAFVQALRRLAAAASARGDYASAVAHLRRAASADPLSGTVAHALMLALAAAGDRSTAIEVGRSHAGLVQNELEAVADTSVRDLMEKLRAGGLHLESPRPAARGGAGTPPAPDPPPIAAPPVIPVRLVTALADRYLIVGEIGSGGMATVYLAQDVKHDREVALKVLRPELAAMLGATLFLNEIRISARLDHPHILTLIDSGEADGFLYYVIPYVRGESLRERLRKEHQLGIDAARSIARQVAAALEYAHRSGVVHRDIKPGNILLREDDAVLTDFGIAVAVRDAGGGRLTESGFSLGTPLYMSPEQATGERSVDARSDIYSLAAVLYEMLTGEPPHGGSTVRAVVAKLLTERPTPVRVLRETVPEPLETAVMRALAKSPADRFASAAEFSRALDSVSPAPAAVVVWRRPAVRILAGAAALVIVGALAVAARSKSAPPAAAGQLALTVRGTPPGVAPSVVVTGPRSYTRIVRDTGVITFTHLPPGTYSVDATGVTSGADAYLPLADSQTVTLRDGALDGAVSVAYADETFAILFERGGDIMAMNADGSEQVNLTNHPSVGGGPVWSPEGRRIAYISHPRNDYEIATMNFDGSAPVNLTSTPASQGEPTWSPDGRRIAFVSRRDGNAEIYVMNADGSGQQNLTRNLHNDFQPQWSPDGRKIAFMSDRGGHTQLYVMNADGSGQRDLSNFPSSEESEPVWSPDGRKIAFVRNLPGDNDEIYVMNADGSGQTNLSRSAARDIWPVWSPDGTKIAFLSGRGGGDLNLFVMNPDGSNVVQLTHAAYKTRAPAWSRDGTKLAYEEVAFVPCERAPCSGRDSTGTIFTVNADGTGAKQLTHTLLSLDAYPQWRPAPRP